MYSDESLNCIDCSRPFVFTAGEQEFFAQKGFANKPNRCPDCRAARKAAGGGGSRYGAGGAGASGGGYGGARPQREMFTARCSQCGGEAKVPFQPSSDKPVYCRDCFQTRQSSRRY